jgi:DNA-3-methyladenine glycosylase
MNNMRQKLEFYSKRAPELAPSLIGKLLCRKILDEDGEHIIKLRITETECYFGEDDTACHAHKGKTERTQTMYLRGGIAYVYLCYGMHSMLNIVSGPEGYPEAVLIRGVEKYNGPGRLTKALKIDRSLNGEDMVISEELWIEDDGYCSEYVKGKRIGIDYATEEYRNILWRYTMIKK